MKGSVGYKVTAKKGNVTTVVVRGSVHATTRYAIVVETTLAELPTTYAHFVPRE